MISLLDISQSDSSATRKKQGEHFESVVVTIGSSVVTMLILQLEICYGYTEILSLVCVFGCILFILFINDLS